MTTKSLIFVSILTHASICQGVMEAGTAIYGKYVDRFVPRSALLSALAGIAVALIATGKYHDPSSSSPSSERFPFWEICFGSFAFLRICFIRIVVSSCSGSRGRNGSLLPLPLLHGFKGKKKIFLCFLLFIMTSMTFLFSSLLCSSFYLSSLLFFFFPCSLLFSSLLFFSEIRID